MMETTNVGETAEIATTKVFEKKEHLKAGIIDFVAGSLGKLTLENTINLSSKFHGDSFNAEMRYHIVFVFLKVYSITFRFFL